MTSKKLCKMLILLTALYSASSSTLKGAGANRNQDREEAIHLLAGRATRLNTALQNATINTLEDAICLHKLECYGFGAVAVGSACFALRAISNERDGVLLALASTAVFGFLSVAATGSAQKLAEQVTRKRQALASYPQTIAALRGAQHPLAELQLEVDKLEAAQKEVDRRQAEEAQRQQQRYAQLRADLRNERLASAVESRREQQPAPASVVHAAVVANDLCNVQ